jgi:hypothetical protein
MTWSWMLYVVIVGYGPATTSSQAVLLGFPDKVSCESARQQVLATTTKATCIPTTPGVP